jgi:hypothetical protein
VSIHQIDPTCPGIQTKIGGAGYLLRDKQDEHSASIRMRKGRRMRDEGRA